MSSLPVSTLLRIRREVIFSSESDWHLFRRLGVSRGTVNRVLLMELPTERCGGCVAKVVMPCLLCHSRSKQEVG